MVSRIVLRGAALLLCIFSVGHAWAGIWSYQGQRAVEESQLESALNRYDQIPHKMLRGPHVDFSYGKAALRLGVDAKNKKWHEKALPVMERLTQTTPSFGRGWLYLALNEYELRSVPIRQEEWDKIKLSLLKARNQEPGNLWIAFLIGIRFLEQSAMLSKEERALAIQELKWSMYSQPLNPDYPFLEVPSELLKDAYDFIWGRFRDGNLLKQITPYDRASYQALFHFLKEHKIWSSFESVYNDLDELKARRYFEELNKGEALLAAHDYQQAYYAFRKAFWMRSWSYPQAKAGLLIAEHATTGLPKGKHPLFGKSVNGALKDILEDEDQSLGVLLQGLEPIILQSGDAYLKGLYAYHAGDYRETIVQLERTDVRSTFQRRRLALAYKHVGEIENALSVLAPALHEENADIRELLLLEEWGRGIQASIRKKIEARKTTRRSAKSWWDKQDSDRVLDSKKAMTLSLMPGKASIELYVRLAQDYEGDSAAMILRLHGRPLQGVSVTKKTWTRVVAPIVTTGGKRYLEAEVTSGSGDNPSAIQLGPLKIEYAS